MFIRADINDSWSPLVYFYENKVRNFSFNLNIFQVKPITHGGCRFKCFGLCITYLSIYTYCHFLEQSCISFMNGNKYNKLQYCAVMHLSEVATSRILHLPYIQLIPAQVIENGSTSQCSVCPLSQSASMVQVDNTSFN